MEYFSVKNQDNLIKDIFIVAEENCMQYARILEILISEKTNVRCTVFDKLNVFEQQKTSSENRVIFIGKNRLSLPIVDYIEKKYDKYNIHYGWRGRRAVIWQDSIFFEDENIQRRFISDYNRIVPNTKKIKPPSYEAKDGVVDVAFLIGGGLIGIGGKYIYQNIKRGDELRDAQYKMGVMEFYTNHLDSFIGVDSNE